MKKIKIIAATLVVALILVPLISCGEEKISYDSDLLPSQLMDILVTAARELESRDNKIYLESGNIYRSDSDVEGEFLTEGQQSIFYGSLTENPDFSLVENYAVWIAQDTVSTEMGIFKVKNEADTEKVEAYFTERVNTMKQNAKDYKPEEELKAQNALITTKGKYVIYIVTNINDELINTIESSLTKE